MLLVLDASLLQSRLDWLGSDLLPSFAAIPKPLLLEAQPSKESVS